MCVCVCVCVHVRVCVCVFMGYYWLLELLCSCLIAAHSDVRAFVKNSYDTLCNEDGDLQHLVRSGEEWRERGGREGGEDRGREGRTEGGREGSANSSHC